MKKSDKITYKISDEQVKYIEEHTFNILYGNTMYWLYSERMTMYLPYLQKKKDAHVSLEDLISYCKNQRIEIYPMPLRDGKLRTNIASFLEAHKMYREGLLIKSNSVARLIIEYSKYCIANYESISKIPV